MSDVLAQLEKQGMKGFDISDDELAKSHVRYMVGGSRDVPDERMFRFGMFPSKLYGLQEFSPLQQSFLSDQPLCADFWRAYAPTGISRCSTTEITVQVRTLHPTCSYS